MPMPFNRYRPYETVDLPDRTCPNVVLDRAPGFALRDHTLPAPPNPAGQASGSGQGGGSNGASGQGAGSGRRTTHHHRRLAPPSQAPSNSGAPPVVSSGGS